MLKRRLRARDDRGAVAVIFALLAVVLMSLAALGTDIGNEVNRHTMTQTQADFAAFAAAQKMTATATAGSPVSSAVAAAVAASMNANQPQDDKGITPVTTAALLDSDPTNGDLKYTADGLQVTAPNHWVSFGMARIMGFSGSNVGAQATVNIFSPGVRVLPMFAVQGCDYGLQTLADPSNGHVTPVAPTLAFDSDTNQTKLTAPAQELDSAGNPLTTLPLNSTNNQLQLTGSKWSQTTKIGFFRGDNPDPTLVQSQGTFWLQGDATKTALAPYTNNNSKTIQLNIPDAVAAYQAVWWVRAYDADVNKWSPRSEAVPITVGNAVLQCGAGSLDGNFGTLKLPRTIPNSPSDWLPVNIAAGLQSPLSLTKHLQYNSTGLCSDGVNGAVTSPGSQGTLNKGTNCVGTDTGLAANVATQGLITGDAGYPGLLTTAGTTAGCDPSGGNNDRTVTFSGPGGSYKLDNNILSCYFTNSTVSVADIAQPDSSFPSSAAHTLDSSITKDPRFVWVPILKVQPSSGGSNNYSIVDVRPGFITDEQPWAASVKGSTKAINGSTDDNGITISNNGITQLKVVFFNIQAMPLDANDQVIDYLGVGDPVVRLVK